MTKLAGLPFQFLKLPYKLLSFLQRRLTNDILLLHRSCESVQAKIYCAADPTISCNVKMADKYQYHGKIGFLWFDIFLKSIINTVNILWPGDFWLFYLWERCQQTHLDM